MASHKLVYHGGPFAGLEATYNQPVNPELTVGRFIRLEDREHGVGWYRIVDVHEDQVDLDYVGETSPAGAE